MRPGQAGCEQSSFSATFRAGLRWLVVYSGGRSADNSRRRGRRAQAQAPPPDAATPPRLLAEPRRKGSVADEAWTELAVTAVTSRKDSRCRLSHRRCRCGCAAAVTRCRPAGGQQCACKRPCETGAAPVQCSLTVCSVESTSIPPAAAPGCPLHCTSARSGQTRAWRASSGLLKVSSSRQPPVTSSERQYESCGPALGASGGRCDLRACWTIDDMWRV